MHRFSSSRLWSLGFVAGLALAVGSVGCSGADGAPSDEGTGEDALTKPKSLQLALTIAESKLVFSSHVDSFAIKGDANLALPCRDRAVSLTSKPSLYSGWSPASADRFSESVDGASFRDYLFASCRDASKQALAWFGKEREFELTVSEQLLDKDYDAKKLPLLLQYRTLGSGQPAYYSCSGAFTKKLVRETASAKVFDISMTCKSRSAPTKGELGPIDFVTDPGSYAAIASYREWMLPPVASTKANFDHARDALLAQVGEGKYAGAMSTLSKTCGLVIAKDGDSLVLSHTIKSSARTRKLVLKADDLLGFVEGDVFEDPIRVSGEPQGKFVAAEFRDDKGESLVVRFEKNTSADAQIVRINGPETYCRRLVAQ